MRLMVPFIQQAYEALSAHWGPQHWWPARTRLEMMLGAVLTQNTAWSNVEKALENLRRNNVLDFAALEKTSDRQLAEWIRPAGYFNQKTRCIKSMVGAIRRDFDGSLSKLFTLDTPTLRWTLLSWKGIGPETASNRHPG